MWFLFYIQFEQIHAEQWEFSSVFVENADIHGEMFVIQYSTLNKLIVNFFSKYLLPVAMSQVALWLTVCSW